VKAQTSEQNPAFEVRRLQLALKIAKHGLGKSTKGGDGQEKKD